MCVFRERVKERESHLRQCCAVTPRLRPVLCYSIAVKIATRHSQQSIKSTGGRAWRVCVPDRVTRLLLVLFPACFDPGSCFCPQDVVEEAVLLLLITESMVRHTFTLFFSHRKHSVNLPWPVRCLFVCLSSRVARRSSVVFQSKPKLARPACGMPPLSMTCSLSAWPGGGSMPCFLRFISSHTHYEEVWGRDGSQISVSECFALAKLSNEYPVTLSKGIMVLSSLSFVNSSFITTSTPSWDHLSLGRRVQPVWLIHTKISHTPRKMAQSVKTIYEESDAGQPGPFSTEENLCLIK